MAATMLLARSFDRGNTMLNSADYSGSSIAASTTKFKTGAYSLRLGNSSGAFARWALSGSHVDPSISFWMNLAGSYDYSGTGTTYFNVRFRLSSATTHFIDLRWDATANTLDAYVNGAKVADGSIEVSVNDWFHVQCYAVIDATGSIGVKIDGHTAIDYTGDTRISGAATCDYVYVHGGGAVTNYDYLDDLVIGYGGFLGSVRCRELTPDSDTTSDWTPSAGGDNYAVVDETPASDADYNETSTNGHVDQLGLTTLDFAALAETPVALSPWVAAYMYEGTGDSIYVGLNSNGTVAKTANALGTAATEYYWAFYDEDPDGGGQPWDATSANAAELYYESIIA